MDALLIIGYVALAAIIVYLSIKLSDYVDMLDKTTKVSGALLGGILLAAVTSLPELFTSMTAVIGVGNAQYVMGNILGSNIFDIVTLGVLILLFVKNFQQQRIARCQLWQFVTLIGLYAVTALAIFLPPEVKKYIVLGGWFNVLSFLIVGLYVFSIFKLDKTEVKDASDMKVKYSVKQLIVRFAIAAALLIAASIGVTYVSDLIVIKYNINATVAGALLLGVMTSLPEVISTFNLFFKKNVNAGTGNIVGSCVFNYLIIFIGELFSFHDSVFGRDPEVTKLIIFGVVAVVSVLVAVLTKMYSDGKLESRKIKIASASVEIFCALVSITAYVLYLTLPGSAFQF